MPSWRALTYVDEPLAELSLPAGPVRLWRGVGSGLAQRRGDPAGVFWAVGDRGPNVSVRTAVEVWGLSALAPHLALDGAKVMPLLDAGPALAELRLEGDVVTCVRTLPIRGADGRPLSGRPPLAGGHAEAEPALDLDGERLAPDPFGADTEGLVALADGGFIVGDEYGPSLLLLDAAGRVVDRWLPAGADPGLGRGVLPAVAAKRRLNRGFEALALSPDERRLLLAFQSPLAHPDKRAYEAGRHVRVWTLDLESGALLAEHLYPLDSPETFRRDGAAGPVRWADLKVSEMASLGENRLLVLERGSATTRLYAVDLDPDLALAPAHLEPDARPTLEELSGAGRIGVAPPHLTKRLVFDTDQAPEISPDLEGLLALSPRELLLVNDNDFGVEGVATRFWRVTLDEDLF